MKFLSVLHAAPMQNLKVRIAINAEYINPNLHVLFSLRLLIINLLPILLLKFNTF